MRVGVVANTCLKERHEFVPDLRALKVRRVGAVDERSRFVNQISKLWLAGMSEVKT